MEDISKYDQKAIAKRIRELRTDKGMTQEELAKRLYHRRDLILNWENPEKKPLPDLSDMLSLCNIFECDLSYLLCENDCKTKDLQGIQDYTGLSEPAITNLLSFQQSEMQTVSKVIASNHFVDLISAFFDFWFKAVQASDCILDITAPPDGIEDYPRREIGDLLFILQAHTEKLKYGRYIFTEICSAILRDICEVDIDSLIKTSERINERDRTWN